MAIKFMLFAAIIGVLDVKMGKNNEKLKISSSSLKRKEDSPPRVDIIRKNWFLKGLEGEKMGNWEGNKKICRKCLFSAIEIKGLQRDSLTDRTF
ncbi:hypothetical protein LJC22_06215 [Desulfosarcina sp. OttesenSCG-928-G10]|nr:hypothetical protein [Desulfosarcina sp. OttesenSCG-928-G10]